MADSCCLSWTTLDLFPFLNHNDRTKVIHKKMSQQHYIKSRSLQLQPLTGLRLYIYLYSHLKNNLAFDFHSDVFGFDLTLDFLAPRARGCVDFYVDLLDRLPPLPPLCHTRGVAALLVKMGHLPRHEVCMGRNGHRRLRHLIFGKEMSR